jgi:hypothetical protein
MQSCTRRAQIHSSDQIDRQTDRQTDRQADSGFTKNLQNPKVLTLTIFVAKNVQFTLFEFCGFSENNLL